MDGEPWPRRLLIVRTSIPSAIRLDARVCRNECKVTCPNPIAFIVVDHCLVRDTGLRVSSFHMANTKLSAGAFGLTCSKYQSGEVDWSGRISRCGDEMMRVMLYEAAQSMLRSKKWSWLKVWAMQTARRRGMKKAIVALARRLAVIMHRIWVDGTEFRWTREVAAA